MFSPTTTILLRASGTSLALDLNGKVPRVVHWGKDLGPLTNSLASALTETANGPLLNNSPAPAPQLTLWPTERDGWAGTPGLAGHCGGSRTTPRPELAAVTAFDAVGSEVPWSCLDAQADLAAVLLDVRDPVTGLETAIRIALDAAGIIDVTVTFRRPGQTGENPNAEPYDLDAWTTLLPVPWRATELLDMTGKWCRERSPQRLPLTFGTHLRESRRGKPGHDSAYVLVAGTAGFGFRSGEVWSVHVADSGDQRYLAERLPGGAGTDGAVIGGGELLRPGEVRLMPGESYTAPTCTFAWSDAGLDGLAERMHRRLRARPEHPVSARPLILNTWEAVYFDHDLPRLLRLVELGAAVGVERVVLDDGWFLGRRGDTSGLGDWTVDPEVWPNGLTPLADRVHALGMEFGLWVEPEMVNLDSNLAREHPEWILAPSDGVGLPFRNQYVLNIADAECRKRIFGQVSDLVERYEIDYLKWDHNRDLLEAVCRRPGGTDRPGVHAQTRALYELLGDLRARFPGLEIETCSGGGGRIDLGIADLTDRAWPSDTNDPVERQQIQRWTGQLLPPELIGTHLGASRAHTTGRVTSLSMRMITALFGHAGIEWDLTRCTRQELEDVAAWASAYRELRGLLHSGTVVRADLPDPQTLLHGVVAQDRAGALFAWVQLGSSAPAQPGRVVFPGLDCEGEYEIRLRQDLGERRANGGDPAWLRRACEGWIALPAILLVNVGLPMPSLAPASAILLELRRVTPQAEQGMHR